MPVYVYRRHDGSVFELEQRITMDSLVSCPTTGQSVERVLQPFSPRYKGTGFYSTDHGKARQEPVQPSDAARAEPKPDRARASSSPKRTESGSRAQ
jgi:predicted nucleic acid-binding Zn ribbon protein